MSGIRMPRRLLAAAIVLLAVGAEAGERTLVGSGDFSVYAEVFSLPASAGRSQLLLVVQFPVNDLSWEASGDSLEARVRCEWSLNALGETHARAAEDLVFRRLQGQAADGSLLYLRSHELPPGEYRLELRCEDSSRRIGGLFGRFGRHAQAELHELVALRDFGSAGGLGDLLLYSVLPDATTRLNPAGLFIQGEEALELTTAFGPPRVAAAGERYLALRLQIHDAAGELRFEKKGGWKYADEALPLRFRLPIAGLEPGEYRLSLMQSGPGLEDLRVFRSFDVLNSMSLDDIDLARRRIEAQLFLAGALYEQWRQLSARDQVTMMERFWLRHDRDPATAENEIYDEFLRRYALAQDRYTLFEPGALSDRGRVLIRYGEPDEITSEAMPLNRTELGNAIRDLHGEGEVEPGISPWTTDPTVGDGFDRGSELNRDLRTIGTGSSLNFGQDSEAFEVWRYELGGRPLLPEFELRLKDIGLKLIFSDRHGYGDFELVYRSEDFEF